MASACKEALILKTLTDEIGTGKDPYVELLENVNLRCHPVNSLEFVFYNLENLRHKLCNPDCYEGLIFLSPRCVEAVKKCVTGQEQFLQNWKLKKIFVVGKKTAEIVRQKLPGLEPLGEHSCNASNLASYILNDKLSRSLLLPHGSLSRMSLYNELTECGLTVDKIVVYKTLPNQFLEEELVQIFKYNDIGMVICFSPSSVKYSLPILKSIGVDLSYIEWIAIGNSTAESIEENGLKLRGVSDEPSPEALARAVEGFLNAK